MKIIMYMTPYELRNLKENGKGFASPYRKNNRYIEVVLDLDCIDFDTVTRGYEVEYLIKINKVNCK